MRIVIATVQVPFVCGGAEAHAESLREALVSAGHEAEIVRVPFKAYPPERIVDHALACRLLDLSESTGTPVDLLIGLKFPAYLIPHRNKVLWILHQHRMAYELWNHPLAGDLIGLPYGAEVRAAIFRLDGRFIPEARAVFANSINVARRLKHFCGIEATPLYHPPPHAEKFSCADAEDYLFFPSRLGPLKRQTLVLEALIHTSLPVRVRFAGSADNPAYDAWLKERAVRLGVQDRVEWLGHISEAEKRQQYARALGVVYPPEDEDYGYVTHEAMLSAKPIVTCIDSGGPLEFLQDRKTGLIVQPTPGSLAEGMDTLWRDRLQAKTWGQKGQWRYGSMRISWTNVVQRLLA